MSFIHYQQKKHFQLALAFIFVLFLSLLGLLFTNSPVFSALGTLIGTFLISIITMLKEDENTIAGVLPIWKFTSYPSHFQFFSLNGDNTVVDSVRLYSIQKYKDSTVINGSSDKTFQEITINKNAVLVSNTEYQAIVPSLTADISQKTKIEELTIICANTIYDDRTFFFEGANLKGAFTLNKKNKVKPYSGDWSFCDKEKAIKYLKLIDECN